MSLQHKSRSLINLPRASAANTRHFTSARNKVSTDKSHDLQAVQDCSSTTQARAQSSVYRLTACLWSVAEAAEELFYHITYEYLRRRHRRLSFFSRRIQRVSFKYTACSTCTVGTVEFCTWAEPEYRVRHGTACTHFWLCEMWDVVASLESGASETLRDWPCIQIYCRLKHAYLLTLKLSTNITLLSVDVAHQPRKSTLQSMVPSLLWQWVALGSLGCCLSTWHPGKPGYLMAVIGVLPKHLTSDQNTREHDYLNTVIG